MKFTKTCECGAKKADFNFGGNILPEEAVDRLYCPSCSSDIGFNPETMVRDNGWVLELDMEVVFASSAKLPDKVKKNLAPDVIFDEGYVTWLGMYPGDTEDSARERVEIVALAKTDPKAYLKKMTTWMVERARRLSNEGWRKARAAEVPGDEARV
jgi:hypothetical protein